MCRHAPPPPTGPSARCVRQAKSETDDPSGPTDEPQLQPQSGAGPVTGCSAWAWWPTGCVSVSPPAWPSPSGSKLKTAPRTIGAFLRRPALLGFLAILSICIGASLPGSPFKLEMAGTWFFGEPSVFNPEQVLLLLPGVVAVYGGMLLFVRVWYGLVQTLRHRPGAPDPPVGLDAGGLDRPPPHGGPALQPRRLLLRRPGRDDEPPHQPLPLRPGDHRLGPIREPGRRPVDEHPGSLRSVLLDGGRLVRPRPAGTTPWSPSCSCACCRWWAWRLIAYCIPKLARAYGRDPGSAFVLAVLNPLTLLALIGGVHNDAIMVGLLLAGITAAKLPTPGMGHHPVHHGGRHQGAGGHRHHLRRLGLGRARRDLAGAGAAAGQGRR